MRPSSILTLGVAVLFGLMAVGAARSYLDQQRSLFANGDNNDVAQETTTLVVAAENLRFGARLELQDLREIEWAAAELPEGAFHRIRDVIVNEDDEARYTRGAFARGEPIIASRITAPGQRPTMSTSVSEGKRAVTIRVDDVLGVAGFVLPGDRVDVMLTRSRTGRDGSDQPYVDILLQAMRVLAIDQLASEQTDKPSVVRSVTFEASPEEAQKLALGSRVGTLSLALRNVAQEGFDTVRRIDIRDLGTIEPEPAPQIAETPEAPVVAPARTVGVYRGLNRSEYRMQ